MTTLDLQGMRLVEHDDVRMYVRTCLPSLVRSHFVDDLQRCMVFSDKTVRNRAYQLAVVLMNHTSEYTPAITATYLRALSSPSYVIASAIYVYGAYCCLLSNIFVL